MTDDRYRHGFFWSLCSMVFLMKMGRVVFAPLVDPLMVEFDVDSATIGTVITLVWVGTAVPRIPTGYLLTYVRRQHVILVSGGVLVAATFLVAVAQSIVLFAVGSVLLGLSTGAYYVAANPLISDLFADEVGRRIGIHGMFSQIAGVLTPVTVGALLVWSWRAAFAAVGVVGLVTTIALYWLARVLDIPPGEELGMEFGAAVKRHWPRLVLGTFAVGTLGFVWLGLFNFYVLYLNEVKALSEATARHMLTMLFATGILAFWLTGRASDRLPHRPLILGSFLTFAVGLFGLTAADGLLVIGVLTFVVGYAAHSLFAVVDVFLLDSIPEESRSSVYAVYSGSSQVLQATGASAIGFLLSFGYGYDAIFGGLGAGLVFVFVGLGAACLAGWA